MCNSPLLNDIGIIGIIGRIRPLRIPGLCTGCGTCVEYCKQCAIALKNGISVLDEQKCVQRGICIHSCPYSLLKSGYAHYQITVGGRAGSPQTKPCARACRIVPSPSGRIGRARTPVKRPFPRSNRAWGGTDPFRPVALRPDRDKGTCTRVGDADTFQV
jgi:ferredoxin